MDHLDEMRVFVTVATLGSFTRAAQRLRLSTSVVSRSIAQLEDRLDLVVLNRTTRSVRLTERGRLYLDSCRQILDDIDVAERRVRGEDAAPRGALKVTAPVLFGRLHVLPIVNRLLAAHRALSIQLDLTDRNVRLVDEGFDVAVRIGELADSSAIAFKLGEVSRIAVASAAYLRRRGVPRKPAELSAHDLIACTDEPDEWRFDASAPPVRFAPRLAVSSADAAIAAAEEGLGITRTLSSQARAAVEAGRLVPVLQAFAPPALPVSVVHPERRIPSASVAAFVRAARDHFAADPLVPVEAWKPAGRRARG